MRCEFILTAVRKSCAGSPSTCPSPGRGQVRVRHTAIGLNFIDIYERTGLYPLQLPAVLGREAAGIVEAVGPGVSQLKVGDRVAYAFNSSGAYSEARVLPAERLVRIPDGVDDNQAAALMLKGMTAQMLLRQTYRVRKGNTLLVHAAAGGVGSILVQWAKHLGATVIAVVGSTAKARARTRARCGPRRCCQAKIGSGRRKQRRRIAASTSSTTRSARTRSSARSIACGRAA